MAPKSASASAFVVCRFTGDEHVVPMKKVKKVSKRLKSGERYQTYVSKNKIVFESPVGDHASCPKNLDFLTKMFQIDIDRIPNPVTRKAIERCFRGEEDPGPSDRIATKEYVASWVRNNGQGRGMERIKANDVRLARGNYGFTKTCVDQCYTAESSHFERVVAILQHRILYVVAYKYSWAELQLIPSMGQPYAFHSIDFLNESMRDNESRRKYCGTDPLCVQIRVVQEPVVANWIRENTTKDYMERFCEALKARILAQ